MNRNTFQWQVETSSVEYYNKYNEKLLKSNEIDVLSRVGGEKKEKFKKPTDRSTLQFSKLTISCKKDGKLFDDKDFVFAYNDILLQFHCLENESLNYVIISNLNNENLLKISVDPPTLNENAKQFLHIVHQKCLERQIELTQNAQRLELLHRNSQRDEKPSKKRKISKRVPLNNMIKKQYKDIQLSDLSMHCSENGLDWKFEVSLSLNYKKFNFNKFTIETNTLLDCFFSQHKKIKSESHGMPKDLSRSKRSTYIQKAFIAQVLSYTKSLSIDTPLSNDLKVPSLNVTLLPFQMKSIQWMLNKERKTIRYDPSIEITDLLDFMNKFVSFGYEVIYPTTNGNSPKFWNKFTNYIASYNECMEIYKNRTLPNLPLGARGLLSEEMGLGKTIEIMSLILLNERSDVAENNFDYYRSDDGKNVLKTKTTLIICPNAILRQWIYEFETHSPSISVFYYKGIQHVKKLFNTEVTDEIVRKLSMYDVIITTYSIVGVEVHYAEYNATIRARRNTHLPKYDYSSPLSLMQFFRIILDEVQMLQSDSTKAAKCTSLLHRVHTWGVSGTPIQLIRDFQTILSYLQIHPFQILPDIIAAISKNTSKLQKKSVNNDEEIGNTHNLFLVHGVNFDLQDLLAIFNDFNLCIRHTKRNVESEISIPKQTNYLVSLNFTPVEWDNYSDVWEAFMSSSGFGPNGSGNTRLSTIVLNQWLSKLRYLCCHAVMPDQYNKNNTNGDSKFSKLHNVSDILKMMRIEAVEKLDFLFRENYQLLIKAAQAKLELQNKPNDAIVLFSKVKDDLMMDLQVKCSIEDPFDAKTISSALDEQKISDSNVENYFDNMSNANYKIRLRSYLDLLHQCYFFIGTCYYFLGSQKLEQVDDENTKANLINEENGENREIKKYTDVFDGSEMEKIRANQLLEQQNYVLAEKLRKQILITRIEKVDETINEVKNYFLSNNQNKPIILQKINFDSKNDYSSNSITSKLFRQMTKIINDINSQTEQFNEFASQLCNLSYQPINKEYQDSDNKENQEEQAQEYSTSIEDQDKIFAILSCMELILENRDNFLTSEEEIKLPKKLKVTGQQLSEYHEKLLTKIKLLAGIPIKAVFDDLKNNKVVRTLSNPAGTNTKAKIDFDDYLLGYEVETKRMKKENKQLRESLKKINLIYNSKTEYYSQLQKISDSLVSLLSMEKHTRLSVVRSIRNNEQYNINLKTISSIELRLKYLKSLDALQESIEKDKSFNCPICLGDIHTGSIIKCGHVFCKKCIHNWLRNKHNCPLCKAETNIQELYSFKFKNEPDSILKATNADNKLVNSDSEKLNHLTTKQSDTDTIFNEKYEMFPFLQEVDKIVIKESFGSKIDMVIKLILFLKLKSQNEHTAPPQILLYSQILDFLKVIAKVLTLHDIKHLSSLSNVLKVGDTISKFKSDPEITCLLLNVKALGSGLNLLNARHIFLLDPIINHGDELQAMSRNNRIGQTKTTFVWNFMIKNSVEENIFRYKCVLEGKKRIFKENEHVDDDVNFDIEEDKKFEMNESTGENVSKKHLWHCFFENGLDSQTEIGIDVNRDE